MTNVNVDVPAKEPISKEYELGCEIAAQLSRNTDKALGVLLTQIEATLGDTKQAEAFKKLVRHEIWRLKDFNQHEVYRVLGVETFNFLRSHEPNDEVTTPLNEDN